MIELLSTFVPWIIKLCVFAVIMSVLLSFFNDEPRPIKKESKSIVETGSMFIFFLLFLIIIQSRVGTISLPNLAVQIAAILVGLILVVVSTLVNVFGRYQLGTMWANHIKIYQDHRLIMSGVFSIVRHPLYASLIWAFCGASLIFFNVLALLATVLIFVPFMYYRAHQEELLLQKVFPEYTLYKQKVSMFIPKIFK